MTMEEISPNNQIQTRWRVCKLYTSSSRHELGARLLDLNELHPLLPDALLQNSTTSSEIPSLTSSASQQQQQEDVVIDQSVDDQKKLRSASSAEIVVLQDGELDPLGAMEMIGSMSLEDTNNNSMSLRKGSSATTMLESQRSSSFRNSFSARSKVSDDIKKQTIKQSWKEHKDRVLAKFADQKFKIKASMLEANILENEIAWTPKYEYHQEKDSIDTEGIGVIKKTRARLEQLEQPKNDGASSSSVKEEATVEMSQSEYIAKIQGMQKELISMWNQGQKVIALKIAIKCVKLLGDVSSPQLYPCVYVLVSDVLDCFGELVFERIKQRASEDDNGMPLPAALPENFTSAEVNIQAKETCRNWFYKTACIRELLPRIYIEIALLKCYRFLCDNEYAQIVLRLSNMIKGVGEPMVALYTRLYLALTSSELFQTQEKTSTMSSLFDYFFTFHHYQVHKLDRFLLTNAMSQSDYLALHSPAVEWLMKHLAQDATQETYEAIVGHYQQFSDNSMVLKHISECFDGKFYVQKPLEMLHLMRVSTPSQFSKCHLYSVLALQLALTASEAKNASELPPKDQWVLFLNEAWTSITAQEDILHYMECAAAYMKLITVKFSHREALILLKDVVRHLNSSSEEELTPKVYGFLGALIENVVNGAQTHLSFLTRVIPSSEFLVLMGMFKREVSVGVAKKVLHAFINPSTTGNGNRMQKFRLRVYGPEAAVAHTLFVICCRVHDALDTLSTLSERQEAAKDICSFICRLGNHPDEDLEEEEALLMLYIDCRSAFYKLESVKITLSMQVLALAMRVAQRRLAAKRQPASDQPQQSGKQKKSSKGRLNFIKSCLAYAHITIPSLSDVYQKLQLMVLCAKVALVNNCLPQLDAFIKNAIIFISEIDPSMVVATSTSATTFGTNNGESSWDFQSQLENWRKDYGGIGDIGFGGGVGISSQISIGTGGGIVDFYEEYLNQIPEFAIVWLVCELVSIMVYTPSCMENDPFYFVNGLRKAVCTEEMTFKWKSKENKLIVLGALIQLCGLWGQEKLPNAIPGIESNDVLYGGDDNFQVQVNKVFSETIELILQELENLSSLNEVDTFGLQMELMLDFMNQIVPFLSLSHDVEDKENNSSTTTPASMSLGIFLLQKCAIFVNQKASGYTQAYKNATNCHTRQQEQLYTSRQEYLTSTKSFLQIFAKEKASQAPLEMKEDTVSTLETLFG